MLTSVTRISKNTDGKEGELWLKIIMLLLAFAITVIALNLFKL